MKLVKQLTQVRIMNLMKLVIYVRLNLSFVTEVCVKAWQKIIQLNIAIIVFPFWSGQKMILIL